MGKNPPCSPSSKPRFSLAAGNSQANLFPALQISGAVDIPPWGLEAPLPPPPGGLGSSGAVRRLQLGAEHKGGGSPAAARKS